MAQVTVHVRDEGVKDRLDALRFKINHPDGLSVLLGQKLQEIVLKNVPRRRGTLASGFERLVFYHDGETGAITGVGLGDPDILTDPDKTPDPRTIGDFADWVRGQNKSSQKKFKKEYKKFQKEQALIQKERIKLDKKRKAELRAEFAKNKERIKNAMRDIINNVPGAEHALTQLSRELYKTNFINAKGKLEKFTLARQIKYVKRVAAFYGFTKEEARQFIRPIERILHSQEVARRILERKLKRDAAKAQKRAAMEARKNVVMTGQQAREAEQRLARSEANRMAREENRQRASLVKQLTGNVLGVDREKALSQKYHQRSVNIKKRMERVASYKESPRRDNLLVNLFHRFEENVHKYEQHYSRMVEHYQNIPVVLERMRNYVYKPSPRPNYSGRKTKDLNNTSLVVRHVETMRTANRMLDKFRKK